MLLPHHLREGCGSVLPVQGHAERLPAVPDSPGRVVEAPARHPLGALLTGASPNLTALRNTFATQRQHSRNRSRSS
nr:hypothetical protein JVH1_5450 [Rhodococcus sp. JVH1]